MLCSYYKLFIYFIFKLFFLYNKYIKNIFRKMNYITAKEIKIFYILMLPY